MRIARHPNEITLDSTQTIGFVPTMGSLHEGHMALIAESVRECDQTAVSIFVNPKQFGPKEDYANYPRDEERDLRMCESAGVDVVFVPTVETIYPYNNISISIGGVSQLWDGKSRPGHFDGVATIVAILFNIVKPNIAYFGLKDFQQCAVIDRLVHGLHLGIALRFVETVREPDGLAKSSRNAYLTPQERIIAPLLYRTLHSVKAKLLDGVASVPESDVIIEEARQSLVESGFDVDYIALVDEKLLEPVSVLKGSARLIVAAKIGSTRLIDNIGILL
ncbi:MAG: pantoate--beta-alanine ligase [Fimbriimonadaceae bacterium]|nr:pantoate--beta-alanine ligase [Fimbriimonadaceae bacterium]